MRRIDRLIIQATELGLDNRLVNMLVRLRVVSRASHALFQEASADRLYEARRAKDAKRSRQSNSNNYAHNRPPRTIKPTKSR